MTTLTSPEQVQTLPAAPGPVQRLWDNITGTAVNVALVIALSLVGIGMILPALTGGTVMTVTTGSMAPSLPPGHIVIYHPADAGALKVGDVIAYQPEGNITGGVPITHRVIEVESVGGHASEVIVQGDANPVADKPVKPGQIIGKMSYFIPFVGFARVLAFHADLRWVIDLLAVGLLGYGVALWVSGIRSGRKKAKAQQAAVQDH